MSDEGAFTVTLSFSEAEALDILRAAKSMNTKPSEYIKDAVRIRIMGNGR